MKKFLFAFIVVVISINVNAQTNIGLFIGGGISVPKISYYGFDTTALVPKLITENDTIEGLGYRSDYAKQIYNVGVNFENVLVERMFYLEFGLQAMGRGYKVSDDDYVMSHGIHIPLTFKYKYFFNRKTENYVSANLGFYGSAYYYGSENNKEKLDAFNNDTTGTIEYDPTIQFGKILIDDKAEMTTFDYGTVGGIELGLFGHLHINYKFGYSFNSYKIDVVGEKMPESPLGYSNKIYYNRYHIITLGYYFTNE